MDSIKTISSWSELGRIEENTLLVFDIDETFLWFPTINEAWWQATLRRLSAQHPPDRVDQLAKEEWLRVVNQEMPVPTDVEGFRELNLEIKRTNSRLTFLTARLESFSHLTRKHLNFCGVAPDTVIHYSSSKGKSLRVIAAKHKNVIFVDDKLANLEDVRRHNPSVQVFRWILKDETAKAKDP